MVSVFQQNRDMSDKLTLRTMVQELVSAQLPLLEVALLCKSDSRLQKKKKKKNEVGGVVWNCIDPTTEVSTVTSQS